ncbi:hypothetical protein D3C81_1657440 [compost metagenome]
MRNPRKTVKSRVPVSWSIIPVIRNSAALYKACTRIKTLAAITASLDPRPSKKTKIPNADIVE